MCYGIKQFNHLVPAMASSEPRAVAPREAFGFE